MEKRILTIVAVVVLAIAVTSADVAISEAQRTIFYDFLASFVTLGCDI